MNAHAFPVARETSLRPTSVDILLLPQFSLLTLAAVVEPLRRANLLRPQFQLRLVSVDGHPVPSAAGSPFVVDACIGKDMAADYTLVCAEPNASAHDSLPDHLRWLWRSGKTVVGIGGGIFFLASAGILAGKKFTLHWEHRSVFRARWKQLAPTSDVYCRDGRIITCAGEMAAADMILSIIEDHCGSDVGKGIMDRCLMSSRRKGTDDQIANAAARFGSRNKHLLAAVSWIEDNFRSERGIEEMYVQIGVSQRQLQRLFKAHVGVSPHQYLVDQRLRQAKLLLRGTNLTIGEVAEQCGYVSTCQFSRAFKKRFGQNPSRFSAAQSECAPHKKSDSSGRSTQG